MSKVDGVKYSFVADRIVVLLAYVVALAGAWIAISFFPDSKLWIRIAIGDFVATVVIFLFSLFLKNSSMYDPYWSLIPIFILGYIVSVSGADWLNPRIILISIVVFYWGIRLTLNWLRTWPGLKHEDWRYKKLARDTGAMYWPVSFLGIHLFPTIMVYLGCLPMIPVVGADGPIIWTDLAGFFISFIAVEIERRSDNQLNLFKRSASKNLVCDWGMWRYSRHPNYFGEISFWAGIFIMAVGLNLTQNALYGAGVICMILLFVFISIPMMEKRQMLKEGYATYRKQVSMLVPWFRTNNDNP